MNRIRFLALASLAICLFYASRFALYPSLGPLGMHQAETAIDLLTGKRTGKSGVGKVHVLFGDPNPAYERALLTQWTCYVCLSRKDSLGAMDEASFHSFSGVGRACQAGE
jgi:hypothetical protein